MIARIIWALWALAVGLILSSVALQIAVAQDSWGTGDSLMVLESIAFLVPATFGALIANRHPRNAIGWLFILLSIAWVGGLHFSEAFSSAVDPDFPPGWGWLIWGVQSIQLPAMLATVTFLFLLFPDGKLPNRRWRPVAWLAAALIVWIGLDEAITRDELVAEPLIHNPARLTGVDDIFRHTLVELGVNTLFVLVVLSSAAALFLRFRGARGVSRQQLKWFALPTVAIAAVMSAAMSFFLVGGDGYFEEVNYAFRGCLLAVAVLLPSSVGIAIIRHNLYDIDLIINRAIVYGFLSLGLGSAYAVTVVGGGSLLRSVSGESTPLLVAASTLLIAALFRPLRTWTQNIVDRRFYRQKYDARMTLQMFGAAARNAVDLNELADDLTGIVVTTMQPQHISIWLRDSPSAEGRR